MSEEYERESDIDRDYYTQNNSNQGDYYNNPYNNNYNGNNEMGRSPEKEAASERLAVAAFVMGILSLVSIMCCCPFIFSALGIILALLSKGASKIMKPKAKAGLIMSIIGMAITVVLTIFAIGFPLFMFNTNPQYKERVLEEYGDVLEQNEDVLKDIYGEDFYDDMYNMIEDLQDNKL